MIIVRVHGEVMESDAFLKSAQEGVHKETLYIETLLF